MTYKAYRSGKPTKKSNAPSASKKRGVGQADARSFSSFDEHVGGVIGDVLMGDGTSIHDKGIDGAHHGPDQGRTGAGGSAPKAKGVGGKY